MSTSNFIIGHQTEEYIYILDISKDFDTITNTTQAVLSFLSKNCQLGDRRLIYRDSLGNIDEIVHEKGEFKRFTPGHSGIENLPDKQPELSKYYPSLHIQ